MNIKASFEDKLSQLKAQHEQLLSQANKINSGEYNGIYQRFENPVVTHQHIPLEWRFDMNASTNPYLMERIGTNAAFNAGAMMWKGKYIVVVRVEGVDRKSYFAIAESENGIDNFRFWERPITLPESDQPDTNVYDMRLTPHEDGWIYGLFCTERRDPNASEADQSAADAKCGIARTKDLVNWERLPDLDSGSNQQRNVVLHPEFVDGKYALYTRPQDGFIDAGKGGGIGWSLVESMENAVVGDEVIIDPKTYHTIKEVKNGQGPAPIKTDEGWLHLAHGVRNCAAGLRYVLYCFMTALDEPWRVIHRPAGHLIAPAGAERIGDVSNVVFSNGWIAQDNGDLHIYYASSDTRLHVATTTLDRLVDYCKHTPEDGLRSAASVQTINELIDRNKG